MSPLCSRLGLHRKGDGRKSSLFGRNRHVEQGNNASVIAEAPTLAIMLRRESTGTTPAQDLESESSNRLQQHPQTTPAPTKIASPSAQPEPQEVDSHTSETKPSVLNTAKSAKVVNPADPETLWDRAYDALKTEEPKLLETYEKYIVRSLKGTPEEAGNQIEQRDRKSRRSQMNQLLRKGLDGTAKWDKVEGNMAVAVNVILSVKDTVDTALSAAPVAALAWTGICVAMQVFVKPITEMQKNRSGIVDIVKRMKWYSSFSKLLLERNFEKDQRYEELREQLTERVLVLYRAILLYIVKTICSCNKNPGFRLLQDAFELNDWDGAMESVENAQKDVEDAAQSYRGQASNTYLQIMVWMHQSDREREIMSKMGVRDMEDELRQIEHRKEDLLEEACEWIFDHRAYQDFADWQNGNNRPLLWIKGDPGAGKTMLVMRIVREFLCRLDVYFDEPYILFFFCLGTDAGLNTAVAVLKGLIHMLIRRERSLFRYLEKEYADYGDSVFDRDTSFPTLSRIFESMLEDEAVKRIIIVIDALDECQIELTRLVGLINKIAENHKKVKWLVSSRKTVDAESAPGAGKSQVSLELDPDTMKASVSKYIANKMAKLREEKITRKTKRTAAVLIEKDLQYIESELHAKVGGTFLWVALLFKQFKGCLPSMLKKQFEDTPPTLAKMYTQMAENIRRLKSAELLEMALSILIAVERQLHLSELALLADFSELDPPEDVLKPCGFLTIRNDVVYFIHQSAKDYLAGEHEFDTRPESIDRSAFPRGAAEAHCTIFSKSMEGMTLLKKDIYDLQNPSIFSKTAKTPNDDPLESLRYSCVYFIDHLLAAGEYFEKNGSYMEQKVHKFFEKHFLHWLEALSLMGNMGDGIRAISKLLIQLQKMPTPSPLLTSMEDMRRFALLNKDVVEAFPLQIYLSALIFSPVNSVTRQLFKNEEPKWITLKPTVEEKWNSCLQTLEGHLSPVSSVAFSPDGQRIVSGSYDKTVKVWDAATGSLQQTLEDDRDAVKSIATSLTNRLKTVSVNHHWVMINEKKALWLPLNRRSICCDSIGDTLVIGSASGLVTIIRFDISKF